jgi:PRTRC genetic system protein B
MELHLSPLEADVAARLSFLISDELLFQWRAGENVQSKLISAQDARRAFANIDDDSGWLPAGVVRTGRNSRGSWVVYVVPPQRVRITTDQGEALHVPIPMSLFVGWGRRYYLYALQGKKFDANAPVYRAPFPNIYENGRICWGGHKVPEVTPANIGKTWKLFFGTTFNNHIAGGKTVSHEDNALDLLRELFAGEKKVFPAGELVRQAYSVESCLNMLFRSAG